MSMNVSRAVLRRSTKLPFGRTPTRFESTASKATEAAKDTASKASEKASDFTSKASDGLSRVSSAAGPAISNAAKATSEYLGKIGGRTGRLIAWTERQIPPTVYWTRVGLELTKLVFQGQKMTPPSYATFQNYFQRVVKSYKNPAALFQSAPNATPSNVISSFRNINSTHLVSWAVITAELLGFFTVGEMIGRFKLVGYHGDKGEHH